MTEEANSFRNLYEEYYRKYQQKMLHATDLWNKAYEAWTKGDQVSEALCNQKAQSLQSEADILCDILLKMSGGSGSSA